jgi:putative photosynthetic complex assembly protein 2
VRNLSEEFLPPHLRYMESFFRRRAVNLLFPVAVTAASLVLAMLVAHAIDDRHTRMQPPSAPRWSATMLALAIVEHWMLVLPLDTTALVALGHPRSRAPQAPSPLCRQHRPCRLPLES